MVGLIPVAFVSFMLLVFWYMGACADGCEHAPDGFGLARNAWVAGVAAWVATFVLSRPRTALVTSSIAFAVSVVAPLGTAI